MLSDYEQRNIDKLSIVIGKWSDDGLKTLIKLCEGHLKTNNRELMAEVTQEQLLQCNYTKFAYWFYNNIKKKYDGRKFIKNALVREWVNPIRLMVEIDKQDLHNMAVIAKRTFDDDFWSKNILSTKKFREQFDQLFIKLQEVKEDKKPVFKVVNKLEL